MSDERYDAAATVAVETMAAPVVARSPRVGYVPSRANRVRDGLAVALLIVGLLLPWSLEFGVGVPGSDGSTFRVLAVVTVLAIGAALAPHLGPFRLSAAQSDVRRTSRIRLALTIAYFVVVVGFVGFHMLQTARNGGTGAVPPGVGPGLLLGVAGALLAAQPPITSITIEDNRFRRWYTVSRVIGFVSIALATLSVAFNVYWRLRYLFVTEAPFGGHDVAVIVTTVLYGAEAMIALVIASRWLTERTGAARLATTAIGVSGAIAATLVWLIGIGRDIDAFHGIAQNTSTAAVGYEGYLAWAAGAAIVAPTTLYAVFLIKPPTIGAYRGAAQKCLTLIAFWAFAAALLRVADFVIALSLDLPRALYDSVAMTGFNLVTGLVARWLHRQLEKGVTSTTVAAAFSAVVFVFTAANVAIGVALAPRYAGPAPAAIYGNNLAQQITSTFDVAVCVLSFLVLVVMVFTGPFVGYLGRRETRAAKSVAAKSVAAKSGAGKSVSAESPATAKAAPGPDASAPPTIARQPKVAAVPRIVRLKEDSTTVLAAPPTTDLQVPTEALRIQRRPPRPPSQG
ncbi:hypothetical protein FR943_22610 [Mycobacterium sp. TNTM28]|uniref:DUF7937 domain-containing protein n=1 Tax=[Mycobacterium] fortunisiensis TaxID=2600579 RepID=A0ABS6KSJ8_9MYCO|nr:hypothetical protein [[Mycobacterium] fortunisiensis]MBU9766620.1 hypothetical protein [[Mycobacterium] fortunisiensis]